jgi:hypothetical protein
VEARGLLRAVPVKIYLPEFVFRLRVWIVLRYRKMRYGYAFRRIPLTRGQYAIVDPERYEELAKHKWHTSWNERGIYAVRMVKAKKGGRVRQKCLRMHRVIMGAGEGEIVDHINHYGLDNRIENLRVATMRQNNWNARKRRCNCSSKYKGVHWLKRKKKWRARITFNGRLILIGDFDDERAAAKAYDAKARELFGDYASLNMPSCSTFTKCQKKQLNRKKTAD